MALARVLTALLLVQAAGASRLPSPTAIVGNVTASTTQGGLRGTLKMAPKPWVDHFNKEHVTLTAGLEEWCLTRDYIANILFLHPCVKEGEPGFEDQHFTMVGGRIYSRDVDSNLCLTQSEECIKPFWASADLKCPVYFTGCGPDATTLGNRQLWEAQEVEGDFSGSTFFLRRKTKPKTAPHVCLANPWDHSKQAQPAKDFPINAYTCNERANLQMFYSYRVLRD